MPFPSQPALPKHWRFIRSPAGHAAENMAMDAALLERARNQRVGFLRCYTWCAPSISLGRNEPARNRFDESELRKEQIEVVRRPTGGRALLHVSEITYSVAIPLADSLSWRVAYAAVNDRLCTALRSLGVDAHIVGDIKGKAALRPGDALCFAEPSPGEIVVGEGKLVGSAVWRERGAFLQQGSIIVSGTQDLLQRLAHGATTSPGPIATLTGAGVSADMESVSTAIGHAFAQDAQVDEWIPDVELQRDARSRVTHFEDPAWLWRH